VGGDVGVEGGEVGIAGDKEDAGAGAAQVLISVRSIRAKRPNGMNQRMDLLRLWVFTWMSAIHWISVIRWMSASTFTH
jgi:hypothetical protein